MGKSNCQFKMRQACAENKRAARQQTKEEKREIRRLQIKLLKQLTGE